MFDEMLRAFYRLKAEQNLLPVSIWFVDCPKLYLDFCAQVPEVPMRTTDQITTITGLPIYRSWVNTSLRDWMDKVPPGVWVFMDDGSAQLIIEAQK